MSTNREPSRSGEQEDPLIGMTLANRYRILRRLGEGGMGVVYSARHDAMNRDVAVKVMLPQTAADQVEVQRFLGEARIAGGLGHPNIVEVFDLGELGDGRPFLVMPQLHGVGLDALLTDHRRMQPTHVATMARGVAGALDVLHAQRIVHRDLKPQNLFLCRQADGTSVVKLLDFGLATLLGERDVRLTRTNMIVGTPQYLAPEAGDGRMLDARGDVYALACIVYQALTGHLPFEGSTAGEIMRRKMALDPPPLCAHGDAYTTAMEEAMARGLHYDPDSRYQSAGAFADDIVAAVTEQFGPVPRSIPIDQTGTPRLGPPTTSDQKTTSMGNAQRHDLLRVFHPEPTTRTPVDTRVSRDGKTSSFRRGVERRVPRVSPGPSLPDTPGARDSDASPEVLHKAPERRPWVAFALMAVAALGGGVMLTWRPGEDRADAAAELPASPAQPSTAPTVSPIRDDGRDDVQGPALGTRAVVGAAERSHEDGVGEPREEGATGSALQVATSPASPDEHRVAALGAGAPPTFQGAPRVGPRAAAARTEPAEAATSAPSTTAQTLEPTGQAASGAEPVPTDRERAAALVSEGTRLLVGGHLPAAVEKFREATHANPGNGAAWRGLGLGYQHMGRNPEARRAFERYLRLAPNASDADNIRARLTRL
ncbi:MAG: protein kinase [Polyangiales bacterium]|nr:protein kinase [Myxococcales bacterium]MCB9656739.1 protein kinase [Sandaracinaceae bacterium]